MLHLVRLPANHRYYTHYIDGKIDGKRRRIFFKSEREAKAALKRLVGQIRIEGEKGLSLAAGDRILAAQAAELLRPYGKNVLDAARAYAEVLRAAVDDTAVAVLFTEYVETKRRAKHQAVSIGDIRQRLGRFNVEFGHRLAKSIQPDEIEAWLHGLGLEPVTVNHYRALLHAFFAYLLKRKRIDANPVAVIDKLKCPAKAPQIFEPEQLCRFLEAAPAGLIPALVIGAFAGLRTSEVLRLDWNDVDLARGFIHVASHKTKTARGRLVTIQPNLAAWLAPFAGRKGKVYCERGNYHHVTSALAATLGQKWPQNGLRHSFASYHLARFQNANALALELGHTTTRLIFEHYRELVRPEAALTYWSIQPPGVPANVVAIGGSRP
jgi:integrase